MTLGDSALILCHISESPGFITSGGLYRGSEFRVPRMRKVCTMVRLHQDLAWQGIMD